MKILIIHNRIERKINMLYFSNLFRHYCVYRYMVKYNCHFDSPYFVKPYIDVIPGRWKNYATWLSNNRNSNTKYFIKDFLNFVEFYENFTAYSYYLFDHGLFMLYKFISELVLKMDI